MKSLILYVFLPFLGIFLLLQLVPMERKNPPTTGEIPVPVHIRSILQRACWDCHSNETRWPWYSKIAPVSWLVVHDVEEGRKELNFSLWTTYNTKKMRKKLDEIEEEIGNNKMPPTLYTWLHTQARLTPQDKKQLKQWLTMAQQQLPSPSR